MKKTLTGVFALLLFSAACARYVHGQAVPAAAAIESALAATRGGTVSNLELVSDNVEGLAYRIVIVNNATTYEVFVNAANGSVFRLNAAPAAPVSRAPGGRGTVTSQGVDLSAMGITPADPPRFSLFRPRNPPVSRRNAVEIGYVFLAARGFPNAAFRRHSGVDRERGRWAWELYFRDGRTEIELYIDMHSGEVVKFDVER